MDTNHTLTNTSNLQTTDQILGSRSWWMGSSLHPCILGGSQSSTVTKLLWSTENMDPLFDSVIDVGTDRHILSMSVIERRT